MATKKVLAILLAITLCFCLVACDSSDYKQAEELYAAGDYVAALEIYTALGEHEDSQNKVKVCKFNIANNHFENKEYKAALEIYTELGEYEDAQDKAAFCEREVGMTENADYAFLADIEKSLLGRMEATKTDNFERITVVNTELAYVEKYDGKTFYDAKLKEIADKYIEGLRVQKAALSKELYYEYQIEWQKGVVLRYEALKDLYEDYGFLEDNADFIGTYVAQVESQQHIYNGYLAVEADIDSQVNSEDFEWYVDKSGYYSCCQLTNNTEYTFGMYFDMAYYDKDNILFETNTGHIGEVKPGETYIVKIYISEVRKVDHFSWVSYYEYIK